MRVKRTSRLFAHTEADADGVAFAVAVAGAEGVCGGDLSEADVTVDVSLSI